MYGWWSPLTVAAASTALSDTRTVARNERKPWKLERGKAVAAAKPVAVAEARQATPSLDLPSAWRRWTEEKGCVYMDLYISLSSECARLLQHAIVRVVVKKEETVHVQDLARGMA